MLRVVQSTSAAARLTAAVNFLHSRPPFSEVVVIGASRGAADDLAREVAKALGATFGILRFSLTELAARAAAQFYDGRRTAGTEASSEAMASSNLPSWTFFCALRYLDEVGGTFE